jgi:pilus assembly protein CpaB
MAMAAAPAPKRVVQRSSGERGGAITIIRGIETKVVNIR